MLFPNLDMIRIKVSIEGLAGLTGYESLTYTISRLRRFIKMIGYICLTGFETGKRPDICVDVKDFLEYDWTSWAFPSNLNVTQYSFGNKFGPLEIW